MKKIAVVMFNLGGPDRKESIKPFLFNFFMDKNIIRLPVFLRFFIAKLISIRRSKREAGTSYAFLGDKSPLLVHTQEQAEALERLLNQDGQAQFKTFVCMRYWHPMADEIATQVKEYAPDEVILLPLYQQFSTTTTRSSFQSWDRAVAKTGLKAPAARICCYPFNEGFVAASAENIKAVMEKARSEGVEAPRILFSAHGLPEDIIKDGDPYQWQCEESAKRIASQLSVILSVSEGSQKFGRDSSVATLLQNDKVVDWQICYQSRVGPKKWLSPSTEDALRQAAADKVAVIIYPHAFTQEHVETLVEIEIEYRHMAEEFGVSGFYRVPTVGVHPAFIAGLAGMVKSHLGRQSVSPDGGTRLCPPEFNRCPCREKV